MLGDDGVFGMGPDNVDSNVANPVGNGVSGIRTLGLSTEGNISLPASPGGKIDLATGRAPSASDASLGLPAGRSNLLGEDGVFGVKDKLVLFGSRFWVCRTV